MIAKLVASWTEILFFYKVYNKIAFLYDRKKKIASYNVVIVFVVI